MFVYLPLREKSLLTTEIQHNHFRQTWTTLHTACVAQKRPSGYSIRQFLSLGLEFCSQLEMHHGIEERHIFPVLARKMPAFQKELELLTHHKLIHAGLEKMQEYLEDCRSGERELRLTELKGLMDGFGDVLWTHLDAEVKELGAENMRKFWSPEEMRRMPM
jgi:hemerythrin-like domain-containing protein